MIIPSRRKMTYMQKLITAGALIGALAALIVAGIGHYLLWKGSAGNAESTGATQGLDLWAYYSMARAVWRSPNGITYSYPYQLYWPTPPILFQLPITALAWIGRVTGLPAAFEIGRIVGAAGCGAALAAIGALFPRGFFRRSFYVAAVLGGGLFGVAAIYFAVQTAGWPGLTEPHQYIKQSEGRLLWWLPFLGSNLRMPLECLYHAIVIGSLACIVWRRHGWAWLLGVAAWMSNPFVAVALHAAAVPWYLWRVFETSGLRRRTVLKWLFAWLAVNALALVYYVWYLNQWPLLRDLHELYRIQYVPPLKWWRLSLLTMPYGLPLIPSLFIPPLRRAIWGRPVWRLFALLAVAHLLLIQQSAFLGKHAMQSYHYDRGYLHLALVVVSWRAMIVGLHRYRLFDRATLSKHSFPWRFPGGLKRSIAWAVCGMIGVTCLDQAFFARQAISMRGRGEYVDARYARLVEAIPETRKPAIVMAEFHLPGSYITAFSQNVAWDAQETMIVPFYQKRIDLLEQALKGKHGGVARLGIDYAIIDNENPKMAKALKDQHWTVKKTDDPYILMSAPRH